MIINLLLKVSRILLHPITKKLQTQLSADALIVRLMYLAIVRYRGDIFEVTRNLNRRSQIAETVEIHDTIASLSVHYPMCAWSIDVI